MSASLSYSAQFVKDSAYPFYIATLFAPAQKREACFAVIAFYVEIQHITHKVSETMLAHIRFAWWREALQEMHAGSTHYKHPLLEALAAPCMQNIVRISVLENIIDAVEANYTAEEKLGENETAMQQSVWQALEQILDGSEVTKNPIPTTSATRKLYPKAMRTYALAFDYAASRKYIHNPLGMLWKMVWA